MPERAKILVLDDEPEVVDSLVESLHDIRYIAVGTTSPPEAIDRLKSEEFDVLLSDIVMPGYMGIDLMREVHSVRPEQLVILMTAFGSIDLAVDALRAGATDFLTKPFEIDELHRAVVRSMRERIMRKEIVRLRRMLVGGESNDIVAKSEPMRHVLSMARRAALSDASVVLSGESGVGKNVVARYIHRCSRRSENRFLQVNCAAIPPSLAESELFGVMRGAYTDARESRPGIFEDARGGTLFLDEIGELPLDLQSKLLLTVENRSIRRVGGNEEIPVDVRIIVASNRSLNEAVEEGGFREDLYYRLNVIPIMIPPLRERPEDIDVFVDMFLDRFSREMDRPVIGVSDSGMRWLRAYHWPGNARELSNLLERAMALSDNDVLTLEDFTSLADNRKKRMSLLEDIMSKNCTLAEVERLYIDKVLTSVEGNKRMAARVLGIDRRTLYRKLERGNH